MNVTNYFKRHIAGTASKFDAFYFFDDKDEDSITQAWEKATAGDFVDPRRVSVSAWKMPFFAGPWRNQVHVIGVTKELATSAA